jgi:hypothetical protein
LEVGGADRNLKNIGRNIESVDEDSDDWIIVFVEGGVDISVGECAVA